jgi:hypothetical protein
MNRAWQDINLPGFSSSKNKEEKPQKFITGVEGDDSNSNIPPEDEVRIISAEWVEGPTTAIIAPTFDPAYVKYTAGGTNAISAVKSVEYIGLWKNAATPQESWATMIGKKTN